jgi:hypothetical protein
MINKIYRTIYTSISGISFFKMYQELLTYSMHAVIQFLWLNINIS